MSSVVASVVSDWAKRVEACVKRQCAAQGVPVKVADPLVLAEIADILHSGRESRASGGRYLACASVLSPERARRRLR